MKVTVTLALDTERDADLVRWLESQHNRSEAVRDAIRRGLQPAREGTDLDTVLAAIDALRRDMTVVRSGEQLTAAEPPDVAAALDRLGV